MGRSETETIERLMVWLLHNKFDDDQKVRELENNLQRLRIEYYRCSVIPFSDDGIIFESDIQIESLHGKPVFVYGSYTLAKIAAKHFSPGAFVSSAINMRLLLANYGIHALNSDMTIAPLKYLIPTTASFFIRPLEDTKSICGDVYSIDRFNTWRSGIQELSDGSDYSTITMDTEFCICACKQIDSEYRCFVVDGKVATASQYRMNGVAYFNSHVDEYIIDFTETMAAIWSPDRAYVMDIAVVDGVPYVIEINCINSSGLYDIDTQKLIIAIEGML